MENFVCLVCNVKFAHSNSFKRHVENAHSNNKIKCSQCEKIYARKDSLTRHIRKHHITIPSENPITNNEIDKLKNKRNQDVTSDVSPSTSNASKKRECESCAKYVSSSGWSQHIKTNEHKRKRNETNDDSSSTSNPPKKRRCESCEKNVSTSEWTHHIRTNTHKRKSRIQVINSPFSKIRQCFGGKVETYFLDSTDEGAIHIDKFLKKCEPDIIQLIENSIEAEGCIKFSIELFAEFVKYVSVQEEEETAEKTEISLKSFKCPMQIALQGDNLEDILKYMFKAIEIKSEEFQERDSGWALLCIKHIEININEFDPIKGSRYLSLPTNIHMKKACVNVRNNDEFCFKWAVISALCPVDVNTGDPISYQIENIKNEVIILNNGTHVNFTNLNFPLNLRDIAIFETLNPSISVNVFGVDKHGAGENYRVVGPYYNSKDVDKRENHINLLLISNDDWNHYVWIRNMSRLLGSQMTHGKRAIRMCNSCLQTFNTDKGFEKHAAECNRTVTILPDETNNILEFEHQSRSLEVPFSIYADFECMLVDITSCQPDPSKSSTTAIKKHVPIAVSYFIKCSFDPSLNKLFKYTELTVALKDVYVTVPTAVKRGDSAMLACNYDIENDTLYTVKWYKGRREFYRYTPKENPAMKIFKLPGINVESTLSNQSHVTLVTVPLSITGKFSCEVSADAPSFHTLIHTAEMEIVELPTQRPIITGIHSRYRLGDVINGNCSSDYSKPAANLTWWINEIAVLPNYIRTYEVQKHTEENLESSVLEINFIVTYQHFIKGRLKLKCTARIHEIYEQETEKLIEEDRPRILASGRSPDVNLYPFDQPGDGEFDDQNEQYLTHHYNKNASSSAAAWQLDSKRAVKMAIVVLIFGLVLRHKMTDDDNDYNIDDNANRNFTRIKISSDSRMELNRNQQQQCQCQPQQDFPTTQSLFENR